MDTKLNGPQLKFAEGLATGLTGTAAYLAAYPSATPDTARKNAGRLKANEGVTAEVQRLRSQAAQLPGSPLLSIREKREYLARLVRAQVLLTPDDSDLWQEITQTEQGTKRKLGDKLKALMIDNEMAGESNESGTVITIHRAWD